MSDEAHKLPWHKRLDTELIVSCEECGENFHPTLAVSARHKNGDASAARFCSKSCSRKNTIKKQKQVIDPETGIDSCTAANLKSAQTKRETVIDGRSIMEIQTERIVAKLSTPDENGLNGWERSKKKTLSKFGRLFPGREQTMLERYGEVCPTRIPEFAAKNRETRIANGFIRSDDEKTAFRRYYLAVWRATDRQQIRLLPGYENRGRCNEDGAFQLDHKLSIIDGFRRGISPSLIGHICNLHCVRWELNHRKRARSWLSLQELVLMIVDYETRY